jgi:hypothetical protein
MAKRSRFEVKPTKDGSGWDVTQNGQSLSHHRTKDPAIKRATKEAQKTANSQVVIKKRDGRIQDERTYGTDPHPPRG